MAAKNIAEVCALLRKELYNNGYEYGFYLDGKKYKPDVTVGFDRKYYDLSVSIYRVQNPKDTMEEKIGTCIDAVVVMKMLLDKHFISNKIWLLKNKTKMHTILTFYMCQKVIYLELTPQSNKDHYGKEIIYDSEQKFLAEYLEKGIEISDITEKIVIGERPLFLY